MLRLAPRAGVLAVLTFLSGCSRPHEVSESDGLTRCAAKVIPYAQWPDVHDPEFSLRLTGPGKGRLMYFGSRHSRDPADGQFAAVASAWNDFRPTIAFYEGPARPIAATGDETIQQFGESGYVRFLANRDGVAVERLEPDPVAEGRHVMTVGGFPPEQVKLFYVLREAVRLRDRQSLSGSRLEQAVTTLLERSAAMEEGLVEFKGLFATTDELQAAYRRHCSEPANWWEAPAHWFAPTAGGNWTNDVNMASSHHRNLHMFRLLASRVRQGHRVFAVVGRNHVPMQAPALRCAIQSH